jgi:hypothetical protein
LPRKGFYFSLTTEVWGDVLKPVLISHATYQDFVLQQLRMNFGPGIVIVNKDWPLVTKLWMTDLSRITSILHDLYSARGPQPRDPASMLRSFLVFLMTNPEKGLTEWVNVMKRTPIYAILSGFELQDIPGVGTFYDFFRRLWNASANHLKPTKQKKRKPKPKKGKKGEKAPTATRYPRQIQTLGRMDDASRRQENGSAFRPVVPLLPNTNC